MKKTFLMAAVAMISVALSAQDVTPLNVKPVEFNLDSIRQNAPDDEQYVNDLEIINKKLKADKDALALASKTAKSERNYYNSQKKNNKQREKQLKDQEKVYKDQAKADKKSQKDIDKQRKALLKESALDQQTLADNNAALDQQEARLRDNAREREFSMKDLHRKREVLKDDMIALSSYELDLREKETKIKNMQDMNKLQGERIKNEIKATKDKIKNDKKMAKLQAE